ncbi:MAG TPA: GNAT family N-acetyltransferase [Ignavibacteria bacterium]|nr:GNAT family N-acetyltransferase [Ignavibacteria bacterium]
MFNIRKAISKDLQQIRELYHDTVIAVNSKDYTEEQIRVWSGSGLTESGNTFTKKIEEQYFYVAEYENNIVGFSSVTDDGYLDYMYVHKDFQRNGIAKALLEKIESKADELKLNLITSDVSITARPFFEKHGYVKTGEKKDLYRGVEFINNIMVKHIQSI